MHNPHDGGPSAASERLKLAELISSRVCQSLIGPLGAVANGVEAIRTLSGGKIAPGEGVAAAAERLDDDCASVFDRMLFFRLAYGSETDGAPIPIRDLRSMTDAFFAGTQIATDWPPSEGAGAGATLARPAARVLLNGILVVAECLGMRGTVAVRSLGEGGRRPSEFQVVGTGRLIPLSAAKCRTLQSDVRIAYLDEQTIHPYLAGQIARHSGIGFAVTLDPHRIAATILLPRAEGQSDAAWSGDDDGRSS
jgi:hypothetical protein